MKKILITFAAILGILFAGTSFAGSGAYVIVAPTASTYTEKSEGGITVFTRSDVSKKGTAMGFSGTSNCQVIDISKLDGISERPQMTFQFLSLTGATYCPPLTGTTIGAFLKGSNVDSPGAWNKASSTAVLSGSSINALTGDTQVGVSINPLTSSINTGVTPYRFYRVDFVSGVSAEKAGAGNLIPVGALFIR